MNLSNLSNRIEIAFWIGVVAFLRDRRVTRFTLLSLVGLLFLAALMLSAFSWAYRDRPARLLPHKVDAIQNTAYLRRPDNGQKNLLLIIVDQLSANEPSLQGVWMLITAPTGRKVTFMPVYPTGTQAGKDLEHAFSQARDGVASGAFLQALENQGLWWDNYLIVDRVTLAALVDLTGGIDIGNGRSTGQQVVGLLSIAREDDQTSLDFQARLAQGICQRLNSMRQNASFETITEILTSSTAQNEAYSDLSSEDLQASWSKMQAAGGLECEFPTLIGR